jgi:hypothetical protein
MQIKSIYCYRSSRWIPAGAEVRRYRLVYCGGPDRLRLAVHSLQLSQNVGLDVAGAQVTTDQIQADIPVLAGKPFDSQEMMQTMQEMSQTFEDDLTQVQIPYIDSHLRALSDCTRSAHTTGYSGRRSCCGHIVHRCASLEGIQVPSGRCENRNLWPSCNYQSRLPEH